MKKNCSVAILSLRYGWTIVELPRRTARKVAEALVEKGNIGVVRFEDENHRPLLVWEREEESK